MKLYNYIYICLFAVLLSQNTELMINDIAVEQWILDTTLPLLMIITVATFGLIRVPFNRLSGSILYAFFLLFIYELTFV